MNVLILNAHKPYVFSPGKLNQTMMTLAQNELEKKGHMVKAKHVNDSFNVDEEIQDHLWADLLLLQTPINWMGTPWTFKKYMDEVYTAGTDGRLCHHDGRSSKNPKKNYGAGGSLKGKKYMLSVTFNAPKEAFDDPNEYLFQGKSVDDLLFPIHMNFRFFGMDQLKTFAAFDVIKNQDIPTLLTEYQHHLQLV